MTPSTSAIVGTRSPRSPCSARRAASIAYATDETGSPITANAKATSRIGRLWKIERRAAVGVKRGVETGHLRADQTSRRALDFVGSYNLKSGISPRASGEAPA